MLIFNFQDNFSPSFVVELRWFVQWPVGFLNLTLIYKLKQHNGMESSIDSRLLAIFLLFILSPIQCRLSRSFLHGCKVFTGQLNECLIRSCVKNGQYARPRDH